MSEERDFERIWLAKFSNCLDEFVGKEIRKEVMEGFGELSSRSSGSEIIDWTKGAMQRLNSLVDEERRKMVMTGCACQYSKSDLQEIKERYQATKDVNVAHQMLQEQFELFLRDTLKLSEDLLEEVVNRGWGSAGIRRGNTIIATKIPKSGYLVEYMKETDPEKKRQYYCHCPRVREILKTSEIISVTYCYCGAGFYKSIWEELLQKPVEVEVLESVLKGDEVCKIAIYLPSD